MTVDLDKVFADLAIGDERVRIFKFMNLVGLDTIYVNYSGGGDSGSVDNIEFHPESTGKRNIYEFISQKFEETLSQPVWDYHGSFADGGGYSVNGAVVWDAKEKTVNIRGTHHYWECDEEGEEQDSSEEDFEEGVFDYEEDDPIREGDSSYDLLYAYAKFVLKDKFPGEYHNRMLAAAIEKDNGAVEYVKWCEGGCK